MPRVPTLNPQVQPRTTVIPESPLSPSPDPNAFGLPQAQARERRGSSFVRMGDVVAQHAIRMQERRDDEQVLLNHAAFQKDLQNLLLDDTEDNGKPKGILARKGYQARGGTIELDDAYENLKEKYLENVGTRAQKVKLLQLMRGSYMADREGVIRHEAEQDRINFTQVLDDDLKTGVDKAALIGDPAALGAAIATAHGVLDAGFKHLGRDPKTTAAAKQNLSGQMVEASVSSVIDRDPAAARAIFETYKDKIPGTTAAKLQSALDGKALNDLQFSTWDQVKKFRLADGYMDKDRALGYVMGLDLPSDKKEKVMGFVQTMSNVANAQLKDERDAKDREFLNQLIKNHGEGVPYETAIRLASDFSFDQKDRFDKELAITELYTSKDNFYDRILEKQSVAQKLAWQQIELLAESKYGTKEKRIPGYDKPVKLKDAFLLEMKRSVLGKPPEEMMKVAQDKLKDVVINQGWFSDDTETAWKIDQDIRTQNAAKMLQLRQTYGAAAVQQAEAFLHGRGAILSPDNIKAALDEAVRRRGGRAAGGGGNGS
jgi:hypothetical protein